MNTGKKSIVVTGSSGFVGSQLVPRLLAAGHRLLLVGRSPDDLLEAYPNVSVCNYEELAEKGQGYDILVHLAGLNSGNALDEETTRKVNIDLPVSVAHSASEAGIPIMVYRSSTHAIDNDRDSIYVRSKREAIKQLEAIEGIEIRTVYLPLVYGDNWTDRFSFLNSLPKMIAWPLFYAMAALKPTCHIETFAKFIVNGASKEPLILSDRQTNNWFYSGIMRMVDMLFAIAVLVLLGWLLVLVWLLIRVGSPGPGIFAQPRIGREGKEFICYKFRTMQQDTPQKGTHEVSISSVTRIGKFLRKTKIDELPQIINIFRNELSLIGPRPCLPVQEELIEERRSRGVLDIKPGISGLAQINDIDMSDPLRLAIWDAKYLALRSVMLDLKIALATVRGHGQGDKTSDRLD
ncbi:sugar transferase [Celeribacter sp.]|uniref:sugar transferase n=1 Tax=Celeribacter sp. TaxID=1890673 RepID=UPI003A9253F8